MRPIVPKASPRCNWLSPDHRASILSQGLASRYRMHKTALTAGPIILRLEDGPGFVEEEP